MLSRQLAIIARRSRATRSRRLQPPRTDIDALRLLYAELGFGSLLRELPQRSRVSPGGYDYSVLDSPAAIRDSSPATSRSRDRCLLTLTPAKDDRRLRRGRGGFELSPQAGVARAAWCDAGGKMLAALAEFSARSSGKIVHDPKLLELLAGPVAGIRHPPCSIPTSSSTTAQHELSELVCALNVTLSGAPANLLINYSAWPLCSAQSRESGTRRRLRSGGFALAPVLAAIENTEFASTPCLQTCRFLRN